MLKIGLKEIIEELNDNYHNHESLRKKFNIHKSNEAFKKHISELATGQMLEFSPGWGKFRLNEIGRKLLKELL